MFDRDVSPEVRASFRRTSYNFVSKNAGGFFSCPPYVIAATAQRHLSRGEQVELPEDYDASVLESITSITGWANREVAVSFRQAAELALIGFQIQDLHEEGKIQPPLNPFQKESIDHLLGEVCLLNFDDAIRSAELSEADMDYIRMAQNTVRERAE